MIHDTPGAEIKTAYESEADTNAYDNGASLSVWFVLSLHVE